MWSFIGTGVVYNVSWEDPRVDCELLNISPAAKDTILMLTSGGCNVLDMVLEGTAKVVAADLNVHQNALLELKCVAIKSLTHAEFFAIFALSDYALFRRVYLASLRAQLSAPAREFWDRDATLSSPFMRNVMWGGSSGLAARLLINLARTLFGLGRLIDAVKDCETLEEQVALYREHEGAVSQLCNFVDGLKPIVSPFIAVPASQLALFRGNIVRHVMDNLFLNTHIAKDNYFYYGYLYGAYTRENCPRYLKAENFAALKKAVLEGRVEIRTGKLHEVAELYPDGYFSRYILLDHMDWMAEFPSMICEEWSVFVRKARKDCRILFRSFASEQHIAPLKYLDFHEDNVRAALAMYPDRVAMYNSTHLATIPANVTVLPRREYKPRATFADDLVVLYNNFVHKISGENHKERLESFYRGQARAYDVFRHRFLHGRVPMIEVMPTPKNGVWLDMGGGTGANLEHLRDSMGNFSRVIVLDLCGPLLEVAKSHIRANGWTNVETLEADACSPHTPGLPAEGTVDLITMSYSLTMIPDWEAALRNAHRMLRVGGYIAVADFTVTESSGLWNRTLWPAVFKHDNVHLRESHIPTLSAMFRKVHCGVEAGGFPWVPEIVAAVGGGLASAAAHQAGAKLAVSLPAAVSAMLPPAVASAVTTALASVTPSTAAALAAFPAGAAATAITAETFSLLRCPYYYFIGQKTQAGSAALALSPAGAKAKGGRSRKASSAS